MSYSLCGKFIYSKPLSENTQKDLSFRIVEAAIKERIWLSVQYNIQDEVYKIVGREHDLKLNGQELIFDMTDAPIWNTAEELVDPGTHDNFDQPIPILTDSFGRVQRALQKILELPEIEKIILYCSEGYDTSYTEIPITVDQLVERSIEWYTNQEPPNEMHGVKFVITRAEPKERS